MKVIFFPNNTASLVSMHVPALRRKGVEAVGYNFAPLKTNETGSVNNWPISGKFLLLRRVKFLFSFMSDLLTSDVIHWMYGGSSRSSRVMLFFVSLLNKKKFVEFCGTDIRSLEKMIEDIPFYKMSDFSENFIQLMGVSKTSQETQYRFSRAGFYALPSYPELIDYIDPNLFPKYDLISRSTDIKKLIPNPQTNKKPIVVHAPSNPEVKGTRYVNKAAERLEEEGLVEYVLIQNMTHQKALETLKSADIVVDQIVAGDYGVLAIEAMALEKPVICFLRNKVEAYYKEHFDDLPITNANINNIYEILKGLALDREKQLELGKRSRIFAIKYHSPEVNAEKLKSIYYTKGI